MIKKYLAFMALGVMTLTNHDVLFGQISGPSPICPGSYATYTVTPNLPSNCSFYGWETDNGSVTASGGLTSADVFPGDIGSSSFTLRYIKQCTTGSGTQQDPYVIQPPAVHYTKTISVNGVGDVTLTPSVTSLPCAATAQSFTVTAGSTNANLYQWSVSGGGSIASPTTGSVVTINKPATCSNDVTVYCTAKRSECPSYPGRSASRNIPVNPSMPSTMSGTDALCTGSSAVYSVTAGANSCWTYSWSISPSTGMTISNTSISNPTVTATSGATSGNKTLTCVVNACGSQVTLTKTIKVCPSSTVPSDIVASRQGTTCYWKFTATASCFNVLEWQINGGIIEQTTSNINTPFEPGTYTVKVRTVNGCGTSAWRTETFNLSPFPSPCMWKTAPGSTEEVAGEPESAIADLTNGIILSPNPTFEGQSVHVSVSNEFEGGKLEVYDANGARAMEVNVESAEMDLDLSKLKSGIYFVRAHKDFKVEVKKLIVTH